MLAQGITPFINLYHFDMPLCMQQRGGWESRAVVEAYARYADTCFGLFGDRVTHWFTFNEPIVPVEAGYLNDLHYPCVVDFKRAVTVAYHSVLAHAMAVQRFRARELPGNIGIILNLSPTYPRSDAPEDRQAAHDADLLLNRSFLDPVAKGRYPAALLQLLERHGLMPHCEPQDAQLIEDGVVDILGVNYYQPRRVLAKEGAAPRADRIAGGFVQLLCNAGPQNQSAPRLGDLRKGAVRHPDGSERKLRQSALLYFGKRHGR